MKYLLTFSTLLICAVALSQVQVATVKSNRLSKYGSVEIVQDIRGTDTSYVLSFRNSEYKTFVDTKIKVLDKQGVIDLVDGLALLTKEEYKPRESSVNLKSGLLLMKSEMLGLPYIAVFIERAWSSLSPKQCRKMKAEVYNALSIYNPDAGPQN